LTMASSFPKPFCVARKTSSPKALPTNHILIEKSFSTAATKLRATFDANFKNPREAHQDRFVWDYWHVPDQYTALRTPAYTYFDQKLYMQFHKELVLWGRRTLGCWDISPPWMSCYIEGCKQELHSDVPHGPWAFVFSLTPWKGRRFSGGETLILRPEVLSYWQSFSNAQDREQQSFVQKIPSEFNQLTVFDPRYPHGVTEVRGTHDPREARLVIHGWFTEPKTYLEGTLKSKAPKVERILNSAFSEVADLIQKSEPLQGTLSLQIKVEGSGRVKGIRYGTKNVMTEAGRSPDLVLKKVLEIYRRLIFPATAGDTLITVPLIIS
jgi:hypothetical protein